MARRITVPKINTASYRRLARIAHISSAGRAMRYPCVVGALACLLAATSAMAVQIDAVVADRQWLTRSIDISGNASIATGELREAMLTKTRSWYAPWRDRPPFDPVTFVQDLERLRMTCERRGYYDAIVTYDLTLDEKNGLVSANIAMDEGAAVRFAAIDIRVSGGAAPESDVLGKGFPRKGEAFVEKRYLDGEQALRAFFLDRGHAHAQTTRHARVEPATLEASVVYAAEPGPVADFGETRVEGLEKVEEGLVLRELSYKPGDRFEARALGESRARILALDLFSAVRITPLLDGPDPAVIPIRIEVEEGPHRDVRIGLGYGTDEGLRGQVQWKHQNWLGRGRQLSTSLEGSMITNELAATFVQPHLLSSERNRGIVNLALFREHENTFDRLAGQFQPRLERRLMPKLSGVIGYRIEYDDLSSVNDETIAKIGGFEPQGILSGPTFGLIWDTSNDPFNPSAGEVISFDLLQAGVVWGGTYRFWRGTLEAKKYVSIPGEIVLAGRLKLGLADSIGSIGRLPIFERFYAGGQRSVRGYARRRLGPLSEGKEEAVGGRSLFEGSIELRRRIWGALGGVLFVDFGQVSLKAFDPPVTGVEFSAGPGITYETPIGPLCLDVGFPFNPPPGDASWQLHFSIGQFF